LKVILESDKIQYYVELAVAGYANNPKSTLSYGERLAYLRDRVRYWKENEFTEQISAYYPPSSMSGVDYLRSMLVRGLFLRAISEPSQVTRPDGEYHRYELVELHAHQKRQRFHIKGLLKTEASIDPGQDLFVLLYAFW
jgi:hypothetical protein